MLVEQTTIPGLLVFRPAAVHGDARGFFTRTLDAAVAAEHGIELGAFLQDSQSRSVGGVLRGLHGRSGAGEAKFVRVAHGAVHDVVVDARPDSPTFGRSQVFRLDDERHLHLYLPPGLLNGFQVLSEVADLCYRIDRAHVEEENVQVRYDDPDLALSWPLPVQTLSERDRTACSWREYAASVGAPVG